jgi:transcriptional regulator with XRE-family HTH domain
MLRRARLRRGDSLRSLANMVGVSHAYVALVERGETFPSSDMCAKLASALGIDVRQLTHAVLTARVARWRDSLNSRIAAEIANQSVSA